MAKIKIPGPLRKFAKENSDINIEANNVSELLNKLSQLHPQMCEKILDSSGELKSYVLLFVNGEDVRSLNGLQTNLQSHSEITILSAMSGG